MKSSSVIVLSDGSAQTPRWRKNGLWMGVVAILVLGAVFALGVSWASIVKFAPYLLILACPAMHLFMCRSKKRETNKSDGPAQ